MSPQRVPSGILAAEPAKIDGNDPIARRIVQLIDREIAADGIEIPRLPDLASRILDFARNPDVSTEEVVRHVRMDPVLAGKLIEMANSAAFAGSEPIYSLQMAVVRLGLNKVAEVAFDLSVKLKAFRKEKRHYLLRRLWRHTVATGFASEELARRVPGCRPEAAFLTGIFHAVGRPAIVNAVGKLERTEGIEAQSDTRVLGLLELLGTDITCRIVRSWNLPKEAQDAIRLQDARVRERRGCPLAHLLACAKHVVADLGIGCLSAPLDLGRCRDFKILELADPRLLEEVGRTVSDRVEQVLKD